MSNDKIIDPRIAAQELIDRYGNQAIEVAADRAMQLELAADWPAHAVALQVLTEVEKMATRPILSGRSGIDTF